MAALSRRMLTRDGGVQQIAVEGCCHGELDTIYAAMQRLEAKEGVKIDLLICCGDFQARRPASRACPALR